MEENEQIINQNSLDNSNKITKTNKRRFVILACIILISLILGAYFYFIAFKSESLSLKALIGKFISPSFNSTPPPSGSSATIDLNNINNWKTYTNNDLGFSLNILQTKTLRFLNLIKTVFLLELHNQIMVLAFRYGIIRNV